ncbi:hypothetical protein Goarm_021560 [Gossypium armourianum]|uniref:ABC transporter domain-containing protein n=1 Tax=Gossypium armourianum TaxID=34283 RepID=A0A7J9IS58_9ROSI|nr:hypothetical protein [Gossypium armourianum]
MEGKQYSECQIQNFEDSKVAVTEKDPIMRIKQPGDEIQEGMHGCEEKTTSETKSWSTGFLVNMESTVAEIDCVSIGVSSNDIDLSVLHPDSSSLPIMASLSEADDEESELHTWKKLGFEPTLPICLKFEDVTYKVPVKGEKTPDANKYILHGITGLVHPGEVLALMGPSGGGKTTLLNLLSGRIKLDSGTITYNNQPYSKSLKWRIGFVLQDDVAFPHLTVKETLTYAALLRLPNTLTMQQKKERATYVISELGLERCQNTVIGGTFFRGISGGERKRVCIANEILLNPSLLLLDEPTSGLDSTTALQIVKMLRNIARSGKTVVTTIHQPSSRLFSKFDKLILLGKGSSLYFGKASDAMLYFSSMGCSPLIAMNPAEFLIDLANGNIKDKSVPSELEDKFFPRNNSLDMKHGELSQVDVHEYLVEAYTVKEAKLGKTKLIKPLLIDAEPRMKARSSTMEWGATWWDQFSILFRRGLKERRHEYFSCIRITQAGLLFFISVFWAFFPMFTAIFTFPQERVMLAKERSVGMYRLSAYLLARMSSDLPLDLILPLVFLVIVYLMAGLKSTFTAFSLTMLTVFLSVVAAQGLGLTIGAAFMDVKKASTLASVIIMTSMLSGGFFIQKVPVFMSWVRYISFTYHTYRLLLKIHYGCSTGLDAESGSSCKSPFKGLRLDWDGMEVGTMVAMTVGYRILAYAFLRRMKLMTIN